MLWWGRLPACHALVGQASACQRPLAGAFFRSFGRSRVRNSMMEYRQIRMIGGKGSAPCQFATSLRSLAVDARGQLYAAGDSEIKVFDASGRLKRRWSTARPVLSVAVGGDGAVYGGQLPQIEIFDGTGKLVNSW